MGALTLVIRPSEMIARVVKLDPLERVRHRHHR